MIKQIGSKSFIIGIAITFLVIGLNYINVNNVQELLQRVEGILYDTRLLVTLSEEKRKIEEQVVIIDIDEKSMQEQGRYPWSRSKVSELVKKLMDAGVIVVAFDIFFAEPERNPIEQVFDKNINISPADRQKFMSFHHSVDADKEFATTLKQSEVVLGFLFDNKAQSTGEVPKSIIEWNIAKDQKSEIGIFHKALGNIPVLQRAATGAGFINSVPESDGFIRKASLVLNYQNNLYPSLALETARIYTLAEKINAVTESSDNMSWLQGLRFGKHFIPTNEKGQIFIPYKGKKHSFPYISATDVLNNRVSGEILEGAVAFIGTSAVGLADLRTTSVGVQYPGVEVHANVFEGLLHPEIIPIEPDITLALTFALLLLTGAILSFIMVRQGPAQILLFCVIAFVIHIGLNIYFWSTLKISLPIFQILLLFTLLTTYYGAIGFIEENSKRKKIKSMFNQYVPPAHIDQLIHTTKGGEIKPERKVISVLFADIRGFTDLSEQLSPEELGDFMKEYLTEATSVIFHHGGTIDKYVGDMVMAMWNAPLDDDNHAVNSILSALKLIELTKQLTLIFKEKGWPAIALGVGISTGEMIVGDMGSEYRKSYTVLGDAVNLGARIESLTKYYSTDILVSENTFKDSANSGLVFRKIDRITVKGKKEAVDIYQPIGLKSQIDNNILEFIENHNLAFDLYLEGKWEDASELFVQLQQCSGLSTTIYTLYLERIALLENTVNKDDWSGVYSHTNK
jgi:adenylate cyclase